MKAIFLAADEIQSVEHAQPDAAEFHWDGVADLVSQTLKIKQ